MGAFCPLFIINNNAVNLRAVMELLDVRCINSSLCIDGPDFIPFDESRCITTNVSIKGFSMSEETKKKIGDSRKGIPRSIETKEKISKAHKGKSFTKETREKLSKSLKGKKYNFNDNHHYAKSYKITFLSGKEIIITNRKKWCMENNYSVTSLIKVQKNEWSKCKDIVSVVELAQ
jgi:hypothetical protein